MAGSIHKSQFATTVKFDVDQASLASLKSALQEVSTAASKAKFQGELTQELNDAAKAAEHLSTILTQSWNSRLNQFDLTKLNNSIKESYGSIDKLKTQLNAGGAVGANAFNKIGQAVLATNIQLKQSSAWLDKMAITMSNTIRFGISSSIMNSFTGSIQKAYNYIQKLDKSLNDIRIVSNASAADMEKFAKYANASAQKLGATTLDYTKAALIYYQQGLAEEQVKLRSDITVKMANVLGDSAEEVSNYMTAIWNNFAKGGENLEYYADVLAKLGAETASSAEEISQGLEKFSAVADAVGLSYEYAAAALTTVTDRTRQSADVVGTAFKTLFARIQDLELGDEGTVTIGKYSEALEKFDIHVLDSQGNLKQMDSILNEMGAKWQTMSSAQKVALAQNVAGVRQYTQLMSLMENWEFFQQNVDSARNATGALQKQQEIYLDSIEGRMNQLAAEAEKMYSALLDEKAIKSFATALTNALKLVNTYLTGLGGGMNGLLTIGANAAGLFSKQIGNTFAKKAVNKEIDAQNEANLIAQQDWVGKTAGTDATSRATKEGLELETEYYTKVRDIRNQLSEQDLIEANNSLKRIGELKERISFAENWREIASQAANETIENEEQIINAIDKEREHRNSLREDILAGQQALEEYKKYVEEDPKGLHDSEDIKKIYTDPLKEMAAYRKQLDDLIAKLDDRNEAEKEQKKELEEEKKIVEEIVQKLESDKREPLTKKEEVVLLKGYNQELETTKDKLHALEGANQGRKEAHSDIIVANRTELEQEQAKIDKMQHEKQLAQEYSTITIGISTILSTMTSLKGIWNTLTSDDLSGWEKFSSVISVVATQGLLVARNWDSLSKFIPTVTKQLGIYNTVEEASNMIKQKGILATLGQIATTILHTTALKLQAIWQTIVNVLTGDWAKVGKAAIVAVIAGTIALIAILGKWIYKTIQANTEQAKLQKKIEESAEALQKAKDAYKELSDSISNYKDARSGLDGLTEGTIEFYDAVMKSNEAAQELIDKLGLVAGIDYGIDNNGLITINEDSLAQKQFEEQQKVYQAQGRNIQARYDMAEYNRRQTVKEFQQTVNTKNGLGRGFSRDQAESILDRSHQRRELMAEDQNGNKIGTSQMELSRWEDFKSTFKQGLDNVSSNGLATTAAILSPVTTLATAFAQEALSSEATEDGITDITEEVGEFRAEYNKYSAEMLALERQSSLAYIRAYGSKEQVEQFNKMASPQQNIIADYVTKQRANFVNGIEERGEKRKTGFQSFFDTSDDNWWGKLWKGTVESIFNVPTLGIHGAVQGVKEATTQRNTLSDLDMKEKYAENVLGYTKNGKGEWVDSSGIKHDVKKEVDLNTAKDAYYSGEYTTKESLDTMLNLVSRSKGYTMESETKFDSDSANHIAEALSAYITGDKNYDYTYLSDDEYGEMKRQAALEKARLGGQVTTGAAGVGAAAVGMLDFSAIDAQREALSEEERNLKAYNRNLQDYNELMDKSAQELGTSSSALKIYDAALQNADKNTVEYKTSTAEAAAASYKFNKAYNQGKQTFKDNKDAWEKYTKALKNHKKISYDVADGAGKIVDSLKDMGLELSTEDLKDPKTLKQIKTLLTGTAEEAEKAYKQLERKSLANVLIRDFKKSGKEVDDIIDKIQNLRETAEGPVSLGDLGLDEISGTAEEVRQKLANLGLSINEEDLQKCRTDLTAITSDGKVDVSKLTFTSPVTTKHTIKDHPDHPGEYTYYDTAETQDVKFALGKDTKVNFTGGNRNFTPGGTGGGKSGGGSSKKKEAKVKSDVDIYHKVNTQIAKVDNTLKKLQRQEEKTFGEKLLNNLQKQWNQLSTQVKNYSDKLKIANKEYGDLRKKLEKQGVKFNEDGTVANYFEIIKQKEKALNDYITKYNKMSAKNQKKNQKKLDKMKKEYEELTANLDRLDTLVSSEIPEIKESLNEALDEQVELNIKAFDLEVNLSLDLKDAKKAWNDFKHKIINGVRDEDILGNANLARNNLAANLNTTTENGNTVWGGDLISQTQHVTEIMREIKLQEQGLANVFGNNTTAAYDALKEAIDRARESYEEVVEYQKELHQSYLDMLDQAKDKLDEQKESYEQIGNLLEHNKRMVELTHGEKAYAILEKYYTLQKENNKNQLTTLKQQQDYYKARMDEALAEKEAAAAALESAQEGTDEWETLNNKYLETIEKFEKTKEHWTEAVQASNDALESSIEFAQESLENTINKITTIINQELTGKKAGLDHAEEEWDLINRNADQYLDKINRLQGENELESKYMDSIDKATNPNTQRKLKAAMDAELKALRDKDKLTQYDLDRANKKYQITLAQIALEEAQQNKTQMRLRRDSQGNYRYQYVADEDSIKKAKEELSSLYTDLYNFDKERYKSTLSEIESVTKEFEEKMAEVAKINDPQEREERELLLKEQYQQLLTAVQKEGEVARYNVIDSAFDDLALLENKHKEDYLAMTQEETDALMTGLIPAWGSVNAKIQDTIEPLAFVTNLMDQYKTAWENTQGEIEDYKDIIYEEEDNIEDFKDQNRDTTEGLIENNEDLINQYTTNLNTLGQMITATDELVDKYKEEYGGVKALETAYAALEAQMQKNLNVYDEYANRPSMITNANEQDQAEENEGVENKDRITDIVTPEAFLNNGIARNTLQAYLKDNGYGAEDVDLITRIKAFQDFLRIPDSGYWDEATYNEAKRRGFDTGGYTGQWGSNNGKLAFLHQKELVLNPEDTVNILNTVALMRELAQWVGQSVFNRLAGVSAGSIGNFENSSTTLDQNVHIEATFPNVTNSNEIEEALKNLVNVASQRITK